jgi:hypothetical protein
MIATDNPRVQELRRAIASLWPDRDDARCLSEIVALVAQLRVEQQMGVRP